MYTMKPRWTAKETNFLVENYLRLKDEEIAAALGKTLKSVRRKRENMLLIKPSGRPPSKPNPVSEDTVN